MITFRFLKTVSYKRFKEFLNSLNKEYESWSLDLQTYKDDKEFYDKSGAGAIIPIDTDTNKMVGFCGVHNDPMIYGTGKLYEISFVVKKEYQNKGIGTKMLLTIEDTLRLSGAEYIAAKHFKDNTASHKAFLKAGYEKRIYTKKYYLSNGSFFGLDAEADKTMDWKIKHIY